MKEEIKVKYNRVKAHLRTHKTTYITGAACLVVGAVSGAYLTRGSEISQSAKNANNALVVWKPQQTIAQLTFQERSTPSKPVCMTKPDGSKACFSSIGVAAKETGHHASSISRNVNGKIPDVDGVVFEAVPVV